MVPAKPFSDACRRNQQPIADVLATYFKAPVKVLEIGSGTGQHGVYVATQMPQVHWQPTDLAEALPGIELWRQDAGLANLAAPLALDVNQRPWPVAADFDAIFTANTVHFVSWGTLENLFHGAADTLAEGGCLLIYGPFNVNGGFTSAGNERLDQWLKQRDPESGIKDRQAVIDLARGLGLSHLRTHGMPANNEILSFVRVR